MKCLDTEKLIRYAYRLTDESAASEVRAHLGECPHCRGIVEQHGRLDALLDEWKAADPSPGFDARVRQAVEAQKARREGRGFWGWEWARGLALASLGVLIVAGVVWFTRSHAWVSNSSSMATRQSPQASGPQTPGQVAKLPSPTVTARTGVKPAQAASANKPAGAFPNDDKDTQALEDYDLAANFDLLSELPKGERRVAN
ncbi:MAG: zf-HC2 domain-containing protein [Terriglobia bacterium]|jgi:Zn-finger nucleic acid-binding protein